MSFAPAYLVYRLCYRVACFFHHWYRDGSRAIFHLFFGVLGSLEQTFALTLTARYFFHPLYGDYSVVGRIVGILFRSARIVIALVLYAVLAACFLVLYLAWVLAIPALIFGMFSLVNPAFFSLRIS